MILCTFFHLLLLRFRACCVTNFCYLFLTYGTICKCEHYQTILHLCNLSQATHGSIYSFVFLILPHFPMEIDGKILFDGNKEFMVQNEQEKEK